MKAVSSVLIHFFRSCGANYIKWTTHQRTKEHQLERLHRITRDRILTATEAIAIHLRNFTPCQYDKLVEALRLNWPHSDSVTLLLLYASLPNLLVTQHSNSSLITTRVLLVKCAHPSSLHALPVPESTPSLILFIQSQDLTFWFSDSLLLNYYHYNYPEHKCLQMPIYLAHN